MPSTVLNTLHAVTHLIFTTNLAVRLYYYSYFNDQESQAQTGQITSLGHTV